MFHRNEIRPAHRMRGLTVAAILAAAVLTTGCRDTFVGTAEAAADLSAKIERGHYLVTLAGCNDCHTPWVMGSNGPQPDLSRRLSGHPQDLVMPPAPALGEGPWGWIGAGSNTAYAGPWGVSFAANLTPDENTGIGVWTEEIFISTLRSGRHWGVARPILPPMPWENFKEMTDEDLKSVFAYLRSIPPVSNRVPEPIPPPAAAAPAVSP